MGWTFLKKLASKVLKAEAVAVPLVSAVSPGLGNLAEIVLAVETIGQSTGMTGEQKLMAATPLVLQTLKVAFPRLREPANAELAKTGATKITSGLADLLNAMSDD